ncbi:MAG: membrane protein insertase YidC [Deltaproteobacteria bacterium]|nr:MAG: membrane protein insertase YidC [Deltaproteobacteria bacterium]
MDRRLFTTIVLCMAILVGWQVIGPKLFPDAFPKPRPVEPTAEGSKEPQVSKDGAGTKATADAGKRRTGETSDTTGPATEATAASAAAEGASGAPRPPARPEREIVLENEVVRVTLSSRGAAVKSWVLKDPRFWVETASGRRQLDLVNVEGAQPYPLSTTFAELEWPADTDYEVVAQDAHSVRFATEQGGVRVEKTLRLDPTHYHVALEIAVAGRTLTPAVHLPRAVREERRAKKKKGFFGRMGRVPDLTRPICAAGDDVEFFGFDEEEPSFSLEGARFTGIDERYFLVALFQGAPVFEEGGSELPAEATAQARCLLRYETRERMESRLVLGPLAPGEHRRLTAFMGPKFSYLLGEYGRGLEDSIDYGWFGVISVVLLFILNLFQGLVGNWGAAILLLTVTVKGLLFPLTTWSMRSMENMRRIQPKMTALKEKYGSDPQRFQQEMWKVYKEEGVSPFGGCLPMLLQFPIWVALYRLILSTAELYHAPFIAGWIDDLAAPEPGAVKILPILMGITMFVMQWMQPTPTTGDDTQMRLQKVMKYFMPPFFAFIMYGLPSGLTLYIFCNNLLSIGQQLWIRRRLSARSEAAAAATS